MAVLRSAVVLIIVGLSVGSARADSGRFEVGGFVGIHNAADDNELGVPDAMNTDSQGSSVPFGARVGFALVPALVAEAELAYAKTEMRNSGRSSSLLLWRTHLLYRVSVLDEVDAFALGGVGFLTTNKSAPDLRADTDFAPYAGVGLGFDVTDRFSVRADARVLFPPSSTGNSFTTEFEMLVGFRASLGRKKSNEPIRITHVVAADPDGDGIRGSADLCPNKPETFNKFEDTDGCPDTLDSDKDGIPDATDKCPKQAEDKDGFEDDDGCPDPDNDKDGVADANDKCPTEKEDRDGFQDDDGCPDPDNDKDGLLDADDKCPNKAEVFNGIDDGDGCPDSKAPIVVVNTGTIDLNPHLRFGDKNASLTAKSQANLLIMVSALKAHSSIRVLIEVHTDDRGDAKANLALSKRRGEAVRAFLILQGIDLKRIVVKGYGESKPLVQGTSRAARAKNRRVVFKILNGKKK